MKHGQEFYIQTDDILTHGGAIPSSSAFLFLSFKTDAVMAILSNQPNVAFELNGVIRDHLLSAISKPELANRI